MESLIGVISDTHGLLRREAIEKLAPCDMVVHAGDIGEGRVLETLLTIKPVIAVRGNMDRGDWALYLPETECLDFHGVRLFVIHNLVHLMIDPRISGMQVVVHGHSHQPSIEYKNDVLYLNPGSIGPRRFDLPVSMAYLRVNDGKFTPELIELDDRE